MCFTITSNVAPKGTRAYKLVLNDRRSMIRGTKWYRDGDVVEATIIPGPVGKIDRAIFRRAIGRSSEAGIYVYLLTQSQVERVEHSLKGVYAPIAPKLIRVRAAAKDFIAQGTDWFSRAGTTVRVATYRKVKVIGLA